jgi:hypothetical protein
MKKHLSRLAIASILAVLFLGLIPILPVKAATNVYFVPTNYHYTTATNPGTFDVEVWVSGVTDMKTWQVKFYYDDTMINATNGWTEPTTNTNYVFYGKTTLPVPAPPAVGSGGSGAGRWIGFGSAMFPAPSPGNGFSGTGLLAVIHFVVVGLPGKLDTWTCDLDFDTAGTYWIAAGTSDKIYFDTETNGNYEMVWTTPANPRFAIESPPIGFFDKFHDWVGYTFDLDVYIDDLDPAWDATHASFTLTWDSAFLAVNSYTVDALWATSSVDDTVAGQITVDVSDPTSTPSGDQVLITIEFIILFQDAVPPQPVGYYDDVALTFTDWYLEDHTFEIPTNAPLNGNVRIYGRQSAPSPYLEVVPHTTTLGTPLGDLAIGDEFDVDVVIRDLEDVWKLVAYQFRLTFDINYFEGVSVTIGPFLKDPRWNWYGTLDIARFDPPVYPYPACAVVGCVLWPNMYGIHNQTQFPSTSVLPLADPVVATIRLRLIDQPIEWPITTQTFDLEIIDTVYGDRFFFDLNANIIDPGEMLDGEVIVYSTFASGKVIDVYGGVCDTDGHGTCPYPAPYGGQGHNQVMDMVWPQKGVCLCVDLTYNYWPIQDKLVVFKVTGPYTAIGEPKEVDEWFIYVETAETDADGQACICFRMPWEGCSNPEQYFGIYEVTAYADLYCETINDTLWFHYDYAVNIFKVTTDKYDYEHGEEVVITITYGSYAQQYLFPATFYSTIKDEVGQPIGKDLEEKIVGGQLRKNWCKYKNGTVTLRILIPKWAAAGYATVFTSVYCTIHGSAWGPGYVGPTILILPL